MQQHTSQQKGFEAGVSAMPRKTSSTAHEFEYGAIAFCWSYDGKTLYPCQVFSPVLKESDGAVVRYYRVARAGLWMELPAKSLLTGWEEDFPPWHEVDWMGFKPIPDEHPSDDEVAEERIEKFFEEPELKEYYSI